ncbi:MAG TPA: hypothetical protein VEZ71_06630 [Archangium sp.]|nr:hypothetical protein [Archangium sp.]
MRSGAPAKASYPKSVKVLLADGHTLHLQFISRASHFADQLMRQCLASRSREQPTDGTE